MQSRSRGAERWRSCVRALAFAATAARWDAKSSPNGAAAARCSRDPAELTSGGEPPSTIESEANENREPQPSCGLQGSPCESGGYRTWARSPNSRNRKALRAQSQRRHASDALWLRIVSAAADAPSAGTRGTAPPGNFWQPTNQPHQPPFLSSLALKCTPRPPAAARPVPTTGVSAAHMPSLWLCDLPRASPSQHLSGTLCGLGHVPRTVLCAALKRRSVVTPVP